MNRKERRAAKKSGAVGGASRSLIDHLFVGAVGSHRSGQLAAAEEQYRQVLSIDPNHSYSLYYLGLIALQTNRIAQAVDLVGKAIALNSREPEWHFDLGLAYQFLSRWTDAISHFQRVVAAKPDHIEAQNNLGICCMMEGRADEAMAHYQRALAINPNYIPAHSNIGNLLASSGQLDKAAAVFQRIIDVSPNNAEAHENLARALLMLGRPLDAVPVLMRGFPTASTPASKDLFVRCVKDLRASKFDTNIHALLVRAMSELWGRPSDLAEVSISLIKAKDGIAACIDRAVKAWPRRLPAHDLFGPNLAAVAQEPLLLHLLALTYVTDVELERFLALARSACLDLVLAQPTVQIGEHELTFFVALAQQCFINEYVMSIPDDEFARVQKLGDALAGALETGTPVPASWPVAIGMYCPLYSLPSAHVLLERSWPNAVQALLVQQVREPAEELAHRSAIPKLTDSDDRTSQLVRQQYEENPYPRWIKVLPVTPRASLDEHLRVYFPQAQHRSLGKGGRIDILIAGCGTGQSAAELAQQFPNARLLAIDLSLASLAYAKRKSSEAGLKNIEFAQADILKISTIGRTFDVIESSGVLHHMADPLAGWRSLLSVLRPGGFMAIGLYSELARRDIVAARGQIADRGYRPSAEDIRRFREDIMSLDDGAPLKSIIRGEFFSLSGCRDLLFHVHEQRFSLPQINEFLIKQGLRLLGFNLPEKILALYAARFPHDKAMANLDFWHTFEQDNPHAFHGMYQFWIQGER